MAERQTAEERQRIEEALSKLRALAFTEAEASDEPLQKTRTEERLDVIVGLMVAGEWRSGHSHRQLAQAWNLSERRIEPLADEASRVIRRYVRDDPEARKDMRAKIVLHLERIASKAERRGSKNGYRDALVAYTKIAEIYGLVRQVVEVDEKPTRFDGWTTEEVELFAATGERPARLTTASRGAPSG